MTRDFVIDLGNFGRGRRRSTASGPSTGRRSCPGSKVITRTFMLNSKSIPGIERYLIYHPDGRNILGVTRTRIGRTRTRCLEGGRNQDSKSDQE